ncbi:MutT NTP pyrophosphohydrolases including oxidative damage repair enzymes [Acidimicrobiia bacterium]
MTAGDSPRPTSSASIDAPLILNESALGESPDLAGVITHLEELTPADEQQASVRDDMLAFANAHPDALHRSCVDGHFTASALVVEEGSDRFIILFHTKLQKWLQPGGHVDGDANLAANALREATEETGISGLRVVVPAIDLDIHEVRPPKEAPHLHLDVRFVVLAPSGSVPIGNHESESLRWVTLDELAELGADNGLVRLSTRGLPVARSAQSITN